MKKFFMLFSTVAIGTLVTFMFSWSIQAKTTLVFSSWGGAYEMSQRRAYAEPFMKLHPNVKIIWEAKSNAALANLRAQVEANNIIWDLVDILPFDAEIACAEGLIEPISTRYLANGLDGSSPEDDFIDGALTECYVASIIYSNVVAYNTNVFKDKNFRMKDVFDTVRYPGKRALERTPLNNLEWALVADGVSHDKIYQVLATKAGQRRAFAKLDTIKSKVIWWEQGAQSPQLLADKEVVFASSYNGRFFNAQVNEGQPFKILWDAQIFEFDGWAVPKGKMTPLIKKFLKFATDTQRLANQAKYISYGPSRLSSGHLVSKHFDTGIDMKPHMPTYAPNFKTAIAKNIEFWSDHRDELIERFNAWLNR